MSRQVAMKRRAHIEILGKGHVRISTSYDTKEFKLPLWKGSLYIDLVTLRTGVMSSKMGAFYCRLRHSTGTGHFEVIVYNAQDGPLGELNTFDCPNEDEFRTTVIEDV